MSQEASKICKRVSESIKHLVVLTTAKEKDCNHQVEEKGGSGWEYKEETWGPVSLDVVSSFDEYGNAKEKAEEAVYYSHVSVYENE